MPIREVVTNPVNRQVLFEALWNSYESRLGPDLRAMHAMAAGMKSVCAKGNNQALENERQNTKWNEDFAHNQVTTPLVFCEKLHGKIDRDYIAEHIVYDGENREIQKKVRWMKEWILGNGEESIIAGENGERRVILKATDKELREVLDLFQNSKFNLDLLE